MHDPPSAYGHATVLFDGTRPLVWHSAYTMTGKEQAKAKDPAPEPIARGIDAGAEDAVKLFESTIADPKALAKTVSARKDAVLFGSELAERYVGGDKVRAQLAKWNLGFKVRDGIQAGVTSSKAVAWIAANLDAAKPGDKRTVPYRALLLYEKQAGSWQLVALHFSFLPHQ